MNSLNLTVDILCGVTIVTAAKDLTRLANVYGNTIKAKFNGCELIVVPGSTWESVCDQYQKHMNEKGLNNA